MVKVEKVPFDIWSEKSDNLQQGLEKDWSLQVGRMQIQAGRDQVSDSVKTNSCMKTSRYSVKGQVR